MMKLALDYPILTLILRFIDKIYNFGMTVLKLLHSHSDKIQFSRHQAGRDRSRYDHPDRYFEAEILPALHALQLGQLRFFQYIEY